MDLLYYCYIVKILKFTEYSIRKWQTQLVKARELQQQQQQQHPKPQHHQQMQMQQLILQRHAQQQQQQQQQQQHQQQRRDGNQLPNVNANGLTVNDLTRNNPATASALATKMYEDRLKVPLQRDSLDDASMKVPIPLRDLGLVFSFPLFSLSLQF